MTIEPNQHVATALAAELGRITANITAATKTRDTIFAARDKARADLAANDEVLESLAIKRDALTTHLQLVAPPLSDDEIADLEQRPGIIE